MLRLKRIIRSIQLIALCAAPFWVHVEHAAAQDLVDELRQIAKENSPLAAEVIFYEASTKGKANLKQDPETAARLFLVGAELCRDLNHPKYPITLFELAIQAQPNDAHIRRMYGDYLIGYRGLQEKAWEQYGKARELLKGNSNNNTPTIQKSLDRSIQIFRRDANDGATVFENEDFSISVKGSTGYSYVKKDILDLTSEYFGTKSQNDFRVNVGGLPAQSDDQIISQLNRHVESFDIYAATKLRAANPNLPTLELFFDRTETYDNLPYRPDSTVIADRSFQQFGLNLEKTFMIDNNIVLENDLKVFNLVSRTNFADALTLNPFWGTVAEGALLSEEESWNVDLNAKTTFHREGASFTVNAGGSFATIDPDYISGDSSNTQRLSLRNSIFYGADGTDSELSRFRGRRSSHQEIGMSRAHRLYKSPTAPITDEDNWLAYITLEELGLLEGQLDFYTTMRYRERSLSRGVNEGNYTVYELELLPVWVPIYNLYDNNFTSGWEHVEVGFPLELEIDDGPYNRVSGGVDVRGRYVIFDTYSVEPSIGVEYVYYTEIEQNDVGGFIKFTIK